MSESAHQDGVPTDYPRNKIITMASEAIEKADGRARVYFKFTCQHCGQRCTFSEPNKLYAKGECFVCSKETDIEKAGFLLVISSPGHEHEGAEPSHEQIE